MTRRGPVNPKRSINLRIMKTLREHPDVWLTSYDIEILTKTIESRGIQTRGIQSRGIGKRIQYMQLDCPRIECRVDAATRKRYYRYNSGDTQE